MVDIFCLLPRRLYWALYVDLYVDAQHCIASCESKMVNLLLNLRMYTVHYVVVTNIMICIPVLSIWKTICSRSPQNSMHFTRCYVLCELGY